MSKHYKWSITAVFVFAVLCIVGIAYPVMFYLNDDITMRSILSGAYTGVPDGHAIHMKYPLAGIISFLYRLAGGVPWFSLFFAGCFWLACSMVLNRVLHITEENHKLGESAKIMACMALLCAALFLPYFIYLHYTVVAAMLGGCGLFLAMTGANVPAVILFVLCYCLRSQVFFLLLPFLGVVVLWQLWEKQFQKQFKLLLLLILSILICMGWNRLFYATDDWQYYRAYNDSRTVFYDYHALLPYEEFASEYQEAGIDEMQYKILESYLLVFDKSVDIKTFDEATQVYASQLARTRTWQEHLRFCFDEYYYHVRYTDTPYNYLILAAYFLAGILLVRQKRWIQLLLTLCMGAGRSLIWIYLIWLGRFPERIVVSLYMLELMVLAGMLCNMLVFGGRERTETVQSGGWKKVIANAAILVIGLTLFGMCISQMKVMGERVYAQKEKQKQWNLLTDYCGEHGDNLYLLDVMPMVSFAGEAWETPEGQQNYLLAGGWVSASPLVADRFARLGASDGGDLLVNCEMENPSGEVLFVSSPTKDVEWIADYLSKRFGQVKIEQVDSILWMEEELFRVYRFVQF